ncbi:hypothetical protein ACFPOI_25830 [Nonomuraea angiospora]|uniref:Uncharacterized protein n=1 Tax=Nonomuraea angiospora TaxID=46172 RepID=A0ABR9LP47_9ACTN|nr:hypothetical protein [Nonomuraea angiospora]MBE1582419.1 hypothetical protein [Nonomuraea angiospora]
MSKDWSSAGLQPRHSYSPGPRAAGFGPAEWGEQVHPVECGATEEGLGLIGKTVARHEAVRRAVLPRMAGSLMRGQVAAALVDAAQRARRCR